MRGRTTPRIYGSVLSPGIVGLAAPWILLMSTVSLPAMSATLENGTESELRAAVTDRAALDAQKTALAKLHSYLKRARDPEQQSVLLFRIAEIQAQNAAILFRIGHAESSRTHHQAKLDASRQAHRQAIATLTDLMRRFPHFPEIAKALYMRGKAYEDLEQKSLAREDYLTLIQKHPDSTDLSSARMALAIFAIEQQHHQEALQFLEPIEKDPTDPHHPFALYKLAWCHYNLSHFIRAQDYLSRQVRLYRKGWAGFNAKGELASSDQALVETSLQDFVLFEVDALERKDPAFEIAKSASKFSDIEKGEFYGKMLLRFARLLKAKGQQVVLRDWAKAMLPLEFHRPEMFEIATLVFEDEVNRHQYAAAAEAAEFFVQITEHNPKAVREFEAFRKAQARLLDVTKLLHQLIKRNKDAESLRSLTEPLARLYDVFTRLVEPTDPRVPGAHLNLAETLYEIRQYAKATEHYRWILEHWKGAWLQGSFPLALSKQAIELRALGAKYQQLYESKQFPETLALKRLDAEALLNATPPEDLAQSEGGRTGGVATWLSWVDGYAERYGTVSDTAQTQGKEFETFYSEALRLRYFQGHAAFAMQKILKWTTTGNVARVGISDPRLTVARLYMDTCIHNQLWEPLWAYTQKLLRDGAWAQRLPALRDTAANAYAQLAHASAEKQNWSDVLARAREAERLLPGHARREELWSLALKAPTQDLETVKTYTDLLKTHFPASAHTAQALVQRANLHEGNYAFAQAADDLVSYRDLMQRHFKSKWTESHAQDVLRKTLLFRWLEGDAARLYRLTQDAAQCAVEKTLCEKYEAISLLTQAQTQDRVTLLPPVELKSRTWSMATHGEKENRALWAGAALIFQDELPAQDRLVLARMIANHWSKLESSSDETGVNLQLALLPVMLKQLPRVFELNRVALRSIASIQPHSKSSSNRTDKQIDKRIERRLQWIQDMESTGTQVAKRFTWARVRTKVLGEIAQLYLEFANELNDVGAPSGVSSEEKAKFEETIKSFVLPLEEKGQTIRRTAFELASQASVEADVFESVSQAFFNDNPSQAQTIQAGVHVGPVPPIGVDGLPLWAPDVDWTSTRTPQGRWAQALEDRNWPWVTYYLQEIEKKRTLDPNTLQLMRAVSLFKTGAQSEALAVLESVRGNLASLPRTRITLFLLTHAVRTYSKSKAREFAEDLATHSDTSTLMAVMHTDREAFALAFAAGWADAQIPATWRLHALEAARFSQSSTEAQWSSAQMKELRARNLATSEADSGEHKGKAGPGGGQKRGLKQGTKRKK